MKKLFLFLILGIALVSFGGCDPINPPEVVKYTITATCDENVTISPASVVVEKSDTAFFNVTTNPGYKSTVKVNGKVVSLTSSKLTLSNVTSDMKVEATSRKIKQYTITATIDSNGTIEILGNNGINSAVTVVDSGKVVLSLCASPNLGYVLDKFKVNGVEKSYEPCTVVFDNVNCDTKVEATTKEAPISSYFFGIKWRMDSIYSRVPGLAGYEEYSLYLYAYPGNHVLYFFSSGDMGNKLEGKFLGGTNKWSVDTSTNPNILSIVGHQKYKVEVRTNKKLVLSYIDASSVPAAEFKETYIPEP